MLASLDLLLIAIAFMIMLMGTARRWSVWRKGKPEVRNGSWKDLIRNLIGHGRILRKPYAGTAHMLLFFGFFVFAALVVLSQTHLTVPRPFSYLLSLFSEILGFFMILATFYFMAKRLKSRNKTHRALFPLIILSTVLLSGFLSEATRLSITGSKLSWQYPIGWLLSMGLPASPTLLQVLIRCHFFLVLLFVATVPFTLMRHAAAAPLNTYFRSRCGLGGLKQMDFDKGPFGARAVMDFSWKQLLDAESCIFCSRCEEVCPAHLAGKLLSPMKILGHILKQVEEVSDRNDERETDSLLKDLITGEEIWSCTTCLACVEQCPVFIDPMDKIIDMRRYAVLGEGDFPRELQTVFENIEIYGDVYGQGTVSYTHLTLPTTPYV